MTYTEDRATFERDIFRPPYLARMLERAGVYVGSMRQSDRDAFSQTAMEEFWWLRDKVKDANDITRVWELALRYAALSRKTWGVWNSVEAAWVIVPGKKLGRH
jgi:nicotinamide mononucleotide adenylyltransferase